MFGPKSILGVDLGSGGIKLIELHQQKHRPVLFTYGYTTGSQDMQKVTEVSQINSRGTGGLIAVSESEIKEADSLKMETLAYSAENVDKYAYALKTVYKDARCKAKSAVVSLPVSAVFHSIVTMPKVAKKEEFNSILRAEIQKLLPRPMDELSLDYQILPGPADSKSQRVLVNAVSRALVAFYTKVFQKVGIRLEALEPESTALGRALVGRDQSISMIVDIGAQRTNFFIIDEAIPITHHSIEMGGNRISGILKNILQIDSSLVEQIKFDMSAFLETARNKVLSREKFIEILMPVVDPIVKEIEYSFGLYLSQAGNENRRPEKIVLTGGAAMLPFVDEYIAQKFQIKCYVGDPWARVVYQDGLKPVLHQIGSRMAVCIGLALRNML
ncbi:MAG: hypothetical protein A2261_01185 [Candidatus Magasanikbacteria bacterium RIFOXYA2_FULL_44_8]|uniref:SHS2 domain-containing protein n=1 Tax=Candidatus Magasanikbacteria bacterium RIFOXYA2_FULL_44_8 TaxID=1798696 RepID=A0A1F6NJR6_9BACT|nr:MAG: hypothetical protein A2261_01185 [Candidatus Magasanikbacteria bacterium RIFOXYA2_FULL_44_8]